MWAVSPFVMYAFYGDHFKLVWNRMLLFSCAEREQSRTINIIARFQHDVIHLVYANTSGLVHNEVIIDYTFLGMSIGLNI